MGAPDILQHLAAAGVKLTRNGANLVAAPRSAVTPDVLQLIQQHKPRLLEALPDPNEELRALVDVVASFHNFTAEQRTEAYEIARADQAAAMECFRVQAAKIPKAKPSSDDRITCDQCAHLVGRKCARWKELGAPQGYAPVQLPLRCEQFKSEVEQRS